jgi:hypothetical protein
LGDWTVLDIGRGFESLMALQNHCARLYRASRKAFRVSFLGDFVRGLLYLGTGFHTAYFAVSGIVTVFASVLLIGHPPRY